MHISELKWQFIASILIQCKSGKWNCTFKPFYILLWSTKGTHSEEKVRRRDGRMQQTQEGRQLEDQSGRPAGPEDYG